MSGVAGDAGGLAGVFWPGVVGGVSFPGAVGLPGAGLAGAGFAGAGFTSLPDPVGGFDVSFPGVVVCLPSSYLVQQVASMHLYLVW